ncbi:MAG: hypothetical protein R3F24_00825 [Gammaproteobacteria bacterium]
MIAVPECRPAPLNGVNPRIARYATVTLDCVSVRRAETEDDFAVVAALRRAGFSRVTDQDPDTVAWLDDVDRAKGTFSLIAQINGEDIGTLRVQDGRHGPVELTQFVDFMPLLGERETPIAQFARLSMLKTPHSPEAMFGLFKAAWRWCFLEGHGAIVIATPIWSKAIYDFMFFRGLGTSGEFAHPFARKAIHYTMVLPAQDAELIWRTGEQPLCSQFVDIEHPRLTVNGASVGGPT